MSLYISPIQIPEIAQGFEINIDIGSPGSELYCKILNMTGIEGFKLMFRGKKISHEASLASQGIKDKAKILMMTELKQAPQKTSLETQLEEQTHTAQSVLLSMGYSEIAVEKALNSVGSGYGTVQKAIDWIAANQSILSNLDNLVQFVPEPPKEKEQSSSSPLQYVTVPRNEPQIEEITEIIIDENELSQAFTWGNNDCGQLGIGSFQNSNIPQNVVGLKGVSVELVECGANHTVYLTRDGDIYYCGRYLIPQVTSIDTDAPVSHKFGDKNKPGILETPIKIRFTQISVGNYHTLAIDSHSRIWSWGRGSEGQLGHSTFNSECYPRAIEKLQPFEITSIGAGAIHSIAVCSTGEVFGWGKNSVGQLGVGTFESRNKPGLSLIGVDRNRIYSVEDVSVVPMTHVVCGSWHTITYNASSQLYYKFGSGREFPRAMDVFLQSGIKVKSIECGDGVTYVLSTMNKLFYINEPNPYESESIDIDDVLIPEQDIVGREIEYIKAGATFILVLTKEGYIYTKGENKRGQLGTADFKDRKEFQAVTCLSSSHVQHVSCGNTHCAAVMKGMDIESNIRDLYMHRETADCAFRCNFTIVNVHKWVIQAHNEGIYLLSRENGGFIDVILSYEAMELLTRYLYGLNLHIFNLEVLNEALTFARRAGMNNFESTILQEIREINDIKKFRAEFPKHVSQSRLFKLRNKAFNLLNQESLNKRTRESLEHQETVQRQAAAEEARQSLLDQGRRIAQDLEQSRRDADIRRQMMLEAIQKRQQGNE